MCEIMHLLAIRRLRLAPIIALLTTMFPASLPAAAPVSGYKVVAQLPHSTDSYTEGFFYRNGLFYEGIGLKGRSALLVIEPESGKVLQRRDLPEQYFGEGIVDWGPDVYEWTWQSHICFVYDRFSLRPVRQFAYTGEGWGMTRTAHRDHHQRRHGHSALPQSNHVQGNAPHRGERREAPVGQLNELEYVKGEIYANIWHSDRIARISPRDGHVIGWIDLTGLMPENRRPDAESVLNGIAYDAQHGRLFVTGKQWPSVFEIKIVSAQPAKHGSQR